jgi:hypothetical protein
MRESKYPTRLIDLVSDPKATSDDELDPTGEVYLIKRKVGRSPRVEDFVRWLDQEIKMSKQFLNGRRSMKKSRRVPAEGQLDSPFVQLPRGVPLDWFDVDFYNRLPHKVRRRITEDEPRASLPPQPLPPYHKETCRISNQEFMAIYGNMIIAQYDIPGSASDDTDDDDDDMMDEEEGILGEGDDDEYDIDAEAEEDADTRANWANKMDETRD